MAEPDRLPQRPVQPGDPLEQGEGRLAGLVCLARLTVQGMWTNRFQQALTLLTMAIGSLALSLTLFIGEGAMVSVWEDLERLMGNWVVAHHDAGPDRALLAKRRHSDFTHQDLECVRQALPQARLITPIVIHRAPVRYQHFLLDLPVDGITPEMEGEALYHPLSGRNLSPEAHQGDLRECLASKSAMAHFGLGENDRPVLVMDGRPFQVVGVVADPPNEPERFQARLTIPWRLTRVFWLPHESVGNLVVAWRTPQEMDSVTAALQSALDQCRGPGTYFLSSSQFKIRKGKQIAATFMVLGVGQALFCILVASIGVFNVMLTNVTRRTNEFAIRIAMGSRGNDILISLLAESALVGFAGAAVGLLAAVALAPHVGRILATSIPEAKLLRHTFTLAGVLTPFVVCGAAGLIAGILPALRVRSLDVLKNLANRT